MAPEGKYENDKGLGKGSIPTDKGTLRIRKGVATGTPGELQDYGKKLQEVRLSSSRLCCRPEVPAKIGSMGRKTRLS